MESKINLVLFVPKENPSASLVAVATQIANCKIIQKGNTSKLNISGIQKGAFVGDAYMLRMLARVADEQNQTTLYGSNLVESTKVDFFLDFADRNLRSLQAIGEYAAHLNSHLQNNTFLVGTSYTVADFLCHDVLSENKRFKSLYKSGDIPHLARWYSYMSSVEELIRPVKTFSEKKAKQAADKKAASSKGGSYEIHLPGASEGNVVTRFPPEPSGYLHIGHIKAALMNDYFAKAYKGRMILRFDDTNPTKEKDEYVQSIHADLRTMGIDYSVVTHTSDHFPMIEEKCTWMIEKGHAYADNTDVEKMRDERKQSIESSCRNQTIEENLRAWNEMKLGSEEGLKYCIRAKIDMTANNATLRDPVMYRCNVETPHHRLGTQYKAYPTYDFACPIVDSHEGVTHALRTTEYHDRDEQYEWFLNIMSLRKVHIWEYSRLNFQYTVLSKRKLTKFVNDGVVDGWNDPRFPTVQGILRRGLHVEALRQFIYAQGASKTAGLMRWDKIWAINRGIIDKNAHRYTAVTAQVPFHLDNLESPTDLKVNLLPKKPEVGTKAVTVSNTIAIEQTDAKLLSDGEEVTLIGWGNAIATKINRDADGNVTSIEGSLNLAGNVKTTKRKLTWINADDSKQVKLKLIEFDFLMTKPKLEEGDNFEDHVNRDSKFESDAKGEIAMAAVTAGQVIQLNRIGNFKCDEIMDDGTIVLFNIPDGRSSKSMSVLSAASKIDKSKF